MVLFTYLRHLVNVKGNLTIQTKEEQKQKFVVVVRLVECYLDIIVNLEYNEI